MAQEVTLKQVCCQCGGTGTHGYSSGPQGGGPFPCQWQDCNGTGYMTFGKFILDPGPDDLQDKHQDILDRLDDILDAIQNP